MAKQNGVWTTLTIASNNLINDVSSLEASTPIDVQEVTGLDKSAIERIALLADLSFSVKAAAINFSASQFHATFKNVTSGVAKAVSAVVGGSTLAANVLFSEYKMSRGEDASLGGEASGMLSDGAVPAWS